MPLSQLYFIIILCFNMYLYFTIQFNKQFIYKFLENIMYEQIHTTYYTMLEGKSKILNRSRKTKGKQYDSLFIYIPSDVTKDSTFPFKSDEEIIVRIDKDRLVIERSRK